MSLPLAAGAFWILAAALTAMFPMRAQMITGIALLILAPVLLIWIGLTHGWIWLAFGLFTFISMFLNPLIYFARRALGYPSPDPRKAAP
jgi:hypothetical protein